FNDAYRQFARIHDSEPRNAEIGAVLSKLQPLLARARAPRREGLRPILPAAADSPAFPPGVPVLRIGIGTTPMGRPRARQSLSFSATTDFTLADARGGKAFASGDEGVYWNVRVRRLKKGRILELLSPRGQTIRRRRFVIAPKSAGRGLVALDPGDGAKGPVLAADKLVRGEVEISLRGRTISVVNILDLENYTHGVLSAEMPVRSPLEALKAQAIVARTHALFIQTVTKRHRRDGYDICDEQHCQVYGGARAESERSRAVVETTRGVIVAYRGRPAHVIYSSNCGGRTQAGRDLTGWGNVPYWKSVSDAPDAPAPPDSPWALRLWLESLPQAYCRPSGYVHPSLFRWSRIIPWAELSRKADRSLRTGRLKRLAVLRRSPSGNVNSLLVVGSRRRVKVDSELAIRGLLGIGSLRSTLFLPTVENGPDGKPEQLVLQGGGWGHGVGLCQSGAMGRAEAGQDFERIILSYFPDTALDRLPYAARTLNR
ncbi:MAG: SpoIID/LytB domain-containing protein, partial [Elusimicrobia bacterium]|nr:SpoIID/LytB domain-containing protein [Elusimicrobiota bacterium]